MARDAKTSQSRASIDAKRRRRAGMPHRNKTARTALPPPKPQRPWRDGIAKDALEAAVVERVRTEVALPPDLRLAVAGSRLQVGSPTAPVGDLVSAQARFMVPE
jgi:hypothetical protein